MSSTTFLSLSLLLLLSLFFFLKQEDPRMTDKERKEMEGRFRRELLRWVRVCMREGRRTGLFHAIRVLMDWPADSPLGCLSSPTLTRCACVSGGRRSTRTSGRS